MILEQTQNLVPLIKHRVQQWNVNFSNKFTLMVRILSVISTALYIVFLYKYTFPWYAYTLKLFIAVFFEYLFYGVVGNFGLFFITTKKAKKNRILATIFYVPSVLITPITAGSFLFGYVGVLMVFLASFFIYYYFNPWRKNG